MSMSGITNPGLNNTFFAFSHQMMIGWVHSRMCNFNEDLMICFSSLTGEALTDERKDTGENYFKKDGLELLRQNLRRAIKRLHRIAIPQKWSFGSGRNSVNKHRLFILT